MSSLLLTCSPLLSCWMPRVMSDSFSLGKELVGSGVEAMSSARQRRARAAFSVRCILALPPGLL